MYSIALTSTVSSHTSSYFLSNRQINFFKPNQPQKTPTNGIRSLLAI